MIHYEPRPGTLPFRVLAHMELLHKGSEISGPLLASAIGVDGKQLKVQLDAALKHRVIFRRQKDHHPSSPFFYSLVDHSKDEHAAPPPGPQEKVHGPGNGYTPAQDSQHVLKAEPARADATDRESPATASPSVGSRGAGQAADAAASMLMCQHGVLIRNFCPRCFSELPGASKPEPKPEVAKEHMVAFVVVDPGVMQLGAFDNGTLHVIRNGKLDVWSREHFAQLVNFLDSIALDAVRGEE